MSKVAHEGGAAEVVNRCYEWKEKGHEPTGTVNSFSDQVTFHRISCVPGGNNRLDVLDGCTDIMQVHRVGFAPFSLSLLAHIIPCSAVPEIP